MTVSTMRNALHVIGLGLIISGATCSASPITRQRYAEEMARCISNERAIVDREGSTREQDEADLAAERARCDAALDAIEAGQ
jgi:hypothetical protein